jgi:hypothetical protein
MTDIVDNFLTRDTIEKILLYTRSTTHLRTNLTGWHNEVVGTSGVILLWDLQGQLFQDIKQETMKQLPQYQYLFNREWSICSHVGTRLSYIPWHNDEKHALSVTVYLNSSWEKEWAGYLLYEEQDHIRALLPKFNRAIVFTPPLMHTVLPTNIMAPLRESLQIFIDG